MGSTEMLCVVCEAAPKAGWLFPPVSGEHCRELLQTIVSLIREHTQHNGGGKKGIIGNICQGFVRFVLTVVPRLFLNASGVELFEAWAILLHRTVAGRIPGHM